MTRYLPPVVVALALTVIVAVVAPAQAQSTISSLTDPPNPELPGHLDIRSARVEHDGSRLIFVIETAASIRTDYPLPIPENGGTYLWFVDTDRNSSTGQPHTGVGSEFNVRAVVNGADSYGIVDVIAGGTRAATLSVIANRVELTVELAALDSPSSFDWQCDTFEHVDSAYNGGNPETTVATAIVDATGQRCGPFPGGACPDGYFCQLEVGGCNVVGASGHCAVCDPSANCSGEYDPVCGCDGVTYGNSCLATAACVSVRHLGECGCNPAAPGGTQIEDDNGLRSCTTVPIAIAGSSPWLWWDPVTADGYRVELFSGDSCEGHALDVVERYASGFDQQFRLGVGPLPDGIYCWQVRGFLENLELTRTYGCASECCCFAVNEQSVCGDGVCDGEESCWGCPNDCALGPDETGRAGAADRYLAVPAAVGGQGGVGGTYWLTEAMVYNASDTRAAFVFEFTPDMDPSTTVTAGPIELESDRALSFTNVVLDLFQTSANGSLRVDATEPVVLSTRTYNQTAAGTYGQGINAARRRLALGEGDGQVYLVGLSENTAFRSNLIVQEVAGRTAQALVTIHRSDGSSLGSVSIDVASHSKVQRRLLDLGFGDLTNGFATVRTSGSGRLITIGSVVDAITGDATTVDAIHPSQVLTAQSKSTAEAHFLVAVVAHTPGANGTVWRSELTVLNPESTRQTVRLEYRPAPSLTHLASFQLLPGRSTTFNDVVGDLFPSAGNGTGALHIYAPEGVAVSSRTYNLLPSGATLGQRIPGLGPGDLLRPDQSAVLTRLKSNSAYRCNLGFTEFSGTDSQVTVRLVAVGPVSVQLLGEATYSVPASSNLQQNRLFESMGISGAFDSVVAYVSITGGSGRVYAYGSNVDNFTGDAETLLAVIK